MICSILKQNKILNKPVSVCQIFTNYNEDFTPMADIFNDILREHALIIRKDRDDLFSELAELGEFDK